MTKLPKAPARAPTPGLRHADSGAMSKPPEPWIHARLRALAEDLCFSARVLSTLADARVQGGLDTEELALAMKAESWAGEVVAVALGIEGALERGVAS